MQSIPKRVYIEHPLRLNARSTYSSSETGAIWPYRGVMVLGASCFLLAVITGIWRVAVTRGFLLPSIPDWWPPHGQIMLGGFLAALIIFERMLPLRVDALIWVPYVFALSTLFLQINHPVIRVIHLTALAGWLVHRWIAYRKFHHWEKPLVESVAFITLSSALIYPEGLQAHPGVALAGLSFPIAVIAIERLEMSLLFKKTGARITLLFLIVWSVLWNLVTWRGTPGLSLMGGATVVLAAFVAFYDASVRTSQQNISGSSAHGLHRFLRNALFLAYGWLFLAAIAMMLSSEIPGAIMKDVMFHLIGLGFIFTMILGHAPLILSATLGKLPPGRAPVIPFFLFQTATCIRILGDFAFMKSIPIWQWSGWISGLLNTVSFFLYMALLVLSVKSIDREKAVAE